MTSKTRGISLVAEWLLPKQQAPVQFWYPAHFDSLRSLSVNTKASEAKYPEQIAKQLVEGLH